MACLIFMHIPKTAGTSFRQILVRQYRNLGGIEAVYDPDAVKTGPRRKDAPAYVGHYRYGFHQFVDGPVRYVSFMRDPIRHSWSHYHFLIEMKKLPGHIHSFPVFLQHKYGNQLQLRFLSGIEDIDGREQEALEQAKKNVDEHFEFIAPMEHFDEALLLMKRHLNWSRMPFYHRANLRPNKPKMSPEERDRAGQHLKEEMELYAHVLKKYEELRSAAPLSALSLRLFHLYNRTYKALDPIYLSVRRLWRR